MSISFLILIAAGILLLTLIIFMLKWGVFTKDSNNNNSNQRSKNANSISSTSSSSKTKGKNKKTPRNLRDRDFEPSNSIAKTAVPFPNLNLDHDENKESGPVNENGCFMGGAYGQNGSYYSGYNGVEFKHAKVNDSYKKLVIPKPVANLDTSYDMSILQEPLNAYNSSSPERLDALFCHMINKGAIKSKKYLVTDFEHQYLEKLRLWFGASYHIFCQVSVGSAVKICIDEDDELSLRDRKQFANKTHNMSFDFLLVDRATDRIVCAIELDDPTHLNYERKARDRRLDLICDQANIPLFHITDINQKPDLNRMV